jgi:hypothetical protein
MEHCWNVLRLPGTWLAECEALRADEVGMEAQMQSIAKGWLELDKFWHVLQKPLHPEAYGSGAVPSFNGRWRST